MKPESSVSESTRTAVAPDAVVDEIEARLAQLEPDLELLAVEVAPTRGSRTVRIFLDDPDGVTHETCARVTGHLADLLREYSVEVSSPGPQRPLSKPAHFRRFIGSRARVRTDEAIDGRSDFKGELITADDEGVTLAGEWGTVTIDYERVRRANLLAGGDAVSRQSKRPSGGLE